MRGEGGTWTAHAPNLVGGDKSPDNPRNQPWLFEDAKAASAYFGFLFKNKVRELDDGMMSRLFPESDAVTLGARYEEKFLRQFGLGEFKNKALPVV